MLCQWYISTFCLEAKDSREAQKIIGPGFGPTQIAVWFPTTIVVSSSVSILPFQSVLRTTILLVHSRELCHSLLFSFPLPFAAHSQPKSLLLKQLIIWRPLCCVFHRPFPVFSDLSPQIANLLCCSTLLVHQGRLYFAPFNSFFQGEKNPHYLVLLLSLPDYNNSCLD